VIDAEDELVRARRAEIRIDLVDRSAGIIREDVLGEEQLLQLGRLDVEVVVLVDGEVVGIGVARGRDVAGGRRVQLAGKRRVAAAEDGLALADSLRKGRFPAGISLGESLSGDS